MVYIKKIALSGKWLVQADGKEMVAKVPGTVYSALMENGFIEDPFYRDNELTVLEIMKQDFLFKKTFIVTEDIIRKKHIYLHCDGLDTLCDIYLNDMKVGSAFNFHRIWEFDIKKFLRRGENQLIIKIFSPVNYIRKMDQVYHIENCCRDAMKGFSYLRKPHCMFGWDWGPRLPDAGIWNDIYLIAFDNVRLEDVYIRQKHILGRVKLEIQVRYQGNAEVCIRIINPQGEVLYEGENKEVEIENPQLWWPNGLGEQNLYRVEVLLKEQKKTVDCSVKRIGLRTLTMVRNKDKFGESFAHKVNGISFFAMGADYIPEDNIFSRITPERTRELLLKCKFAHFNVIRVWGGGAYPSDFFFDICDELGLVVWQDFMFACANYYLTDEFEKNITAELVDNIRRIRHHACLGLWCGNNEMEMFTKEENYEGHHIMKGFYIRIYEHIIPHILQNEDPDTFYWPASPSSGGSFDEPNAENRGDVHYWDVWHGGKPFSEYRRYYFRYVSEFGFQSFPSEKTIKSFTLPEDRNIFSRVMEMHQRNEGANGKILQYLSKTYLYPKEFGTLLYASQLLQAEAIRYGVEHWRRNRGRCMGTIYWQLNDIWPSASWSSVDYFGRLKALHYYARRFFSPIMISCKETSETTMRTSVVEEPGEVFNKMQLVVANETKQDVRGTVRWRLRDADSRIILGNEEEITVEAFSSRWLQETDFQNLDFLNLHLEYEFETVGNIISKGSVLFTEPKHYHFHNPMLKGKIQGNKISIHAEAYAKSIEIYSDQEDFILSDNFFDMEAGEVKVEILEGNPKNIQLRSVYDIR